MIVTAAVAIYFIAGIKPPLATGEIVQVWAHPQHTVTSGFDANGAPMPQESFDQVFVFARVKLHNQSKQPLFLQQCMANAKHGRRHSLQLRGQRGRLRRVFLAYPELAVLRGQGAFAAGHHRPRRRRVEGTIVSAFRSQKQEWDARKDLNFTFAFSYQPSLVLAPHTAIIEQ